MPIKEAGSTSFGSATSRSGVFRLLIGSACPPLSPDQDPGPRDHRVHGRTGATPGRPRASSGAGSRAAAVRSFTRSVRPSSGRGRSARLEPVLGSPSARTLLERERAFSTDASHQIHTPLTGLRLELEAALDNPQRDPRAALIAGIAAVDRLQETVEDLLALARDTPRNRTDLERLDLDRVLAEVREHWAQPLAAAGRRLDVRREPDTPPAAASPAAVRQVLTVLLDNALLHGMGAGHRGRPRRRWRAGPRRTRRGPNDHRGRIGTVPAALAPRRRDGIGLALARGLAEAEGGRLRLSTPHPPTFMLLIAPDDDSPPAHPPPGGTEPHLCPHSLRVPASMRASAWKPRPPATRSWSPT